MRHFARFTDPGFARVQSSSDNEQLKTSAWISPDGAQLTVVVLNTGGDMLDVSVDPGAFSVSKAEAFRTTYRPRESDRWRPLKAAGHEGVLRMPGRSIATLVLRH